MRGPTGPAMASSGAIGLAGAPASVGAPVVMDPPDCVVEGAPPGPPPAGIDVLPASGHESAQTDSQFSSHLPAGPIDDASEGVGTMQQTCAPLQMTAPHCTPSPSKAAP